MYNVVQLPGQTAGFLGSSHNPFQVSTDPSLANLTLGELELPKDITLARLDDRVALAHVLDQPHSRQGRISHETAAASSVFLEHDVYAAEALRLFHSPAIQRVFHLAGEDPRLRDRYGRTKHGQSLLLARRLIEAGVRFVAVYDGQHNGQLANWDAHENIFSRLKDDLLPPADRALAALVDDLTDRCLLESTLVVATGEFGRTPRVNGNAGRDHWPHCYSVVLAGGGIRGGVVLGSSDKVGAYPETDPITPADLAASIFWCFGLDSGKTLTDLSGRPYQLADGRPIRELFG
jgi:hypothetical protein